MKPLTTFLRHRMTASAILLLLPMLTAATLTAQENPQAAFERSHQTLRGGMFVLGGWAVANMAWGASDWTRKQGSEKYFGQMNFFWNTVNLAIAGYALYQSVPNAEAAFDVSKALKQHQRMEKLLLVNSILDVAYAGAGYWMYKSGQQVHKRADMLKGFGSSVMLQGSFLLVFDLAMYGLMRSARPLPTSNISLQLMPSSEGLRLVLNF